MPVNLSWNWRTISVVVLIVVTVVGAIAFMLFGVSTGLSEWRDVRMTVVVPAVNPDVAEHVAVGDRVYTDPAAMYVGTIDEVSVEPMLKSSPDNQGMLQVSEDPLTREVTIVISTDGRESDEIIAIGNQVVQVGGQFTVVTKEYQLRGQITRIDVR
jgi:hypothetical protein